MKYAIGAVVLEIGLAVIFWFRKKNILNRKISGSVCKVLKIYLWFKNFPSGHKWENRYSLRICVWYETWLYHHASECRFVVIVPPPHSTLMIKLFWVAIRSSWSWKHYLYLRNRNDLKRRFLAMKTFELIRLVKADKRESLAVGFFRELKSHLVVGLICKLLLKCLCEVFWKKFLVDDLSWNFNYLINPLLPKL